MWQIKNQRATREQHFLIDELKTHKMWDQIRIVYLVKTDVKKIREGFKKNDPKSDWLLKNTTKPETLNRAATMVSEYGKYFQAEAEKYGFKVFNTKDDFFEKLEEAAKYLLK